MSTGLSWKGCDPKRQVKMINIHITGNCGPGTVVTKSVIVTDEIKEQDGLDTTVEFAVTTMVGRSLFCGLERIRQIIAFNQHGHAVGRWQDINVLDVNECSVYEEQIASLILDNIGINDKDKLVEKTVRELFVNGAGKDSIIKYITGKGYNEWFAKQWYDVLTIDW